MLILTLNQINMRDMRVLKILAICCRPFQKKRKHHWKSCVQMVQFFTIYKLVHIMLWTSHGVQNISIAYIPW